MRCNTIPSVAIAALLTAVLTACTDGDGPLETDPTEPYALPSLDSACDGAPSGQDLLDGVQDEYSARFEYTDGSRTTPLRIGIAYQGGDIICHPAKFAPSGSRAPDHAAFIEVEVELVFMTDDGTFAEAFRVPISGGFGAATTFAFRATPDQLAGTFEPNLPGYEDVRVAFDGTFREASTSGVVIETGQRSGSVGESSILAVWRN